VRRHVCTHRSRDDRCVSSNDPDGVDASDHHREVLRRLVEAADEERRLVTPTQLAGDRWFEADADLNPAGIQPTHLLSALDDLVRLGLAERIVPTAGVSSYRPTELGRQRSRDCDE